MYNVGIDDVRYADVTMTAGRGGFTWLAAQPGVQVVDLVLLSSIPTKPHN